MEGGKLKKRGLLALICLVLFIFVVGVFYELLKVTEIIPVTQVEVGEKIE